MSEALDHRPSLIPPEEALQHLLQLLPTPRRQEVLPLLEADGRVLAAAQRANMAVPPWHNSAMDGIALSSADLERGQRLFRVSQRIVAGASAPPLMAGTAARIFTGAPLPSGADTVVIQENCRFDEDTVQVLRTAACGDNVRAAGDDLAPGQELFKAGHRLRSVDIALLAACGIAEVPVWARPRVAVLTTGDELVEPGHALQPGQIYNANRYLLAALLRATGCEPVLLDNVPDDAGCTRSAVTEAARLADCVLSSGGVSVGGEDHVRDAIEAVGELDLWRLAIKPGKPFAFGRLPAADGGLNVPFFGLPGNPVSAFVTFCLLVRPALQQMAGYAGENRPIRQLPAAFSFETGLRQEYLRVSLRDGNQGPELAPYPNQSSGVLSSLARCDGFAVLPPHSRIEPGRMLSFIAFNDILAAS